MPADSYTSWANPPQPIKLYGDEVRRFIEQRMAFVLREVRELTTEEICKILEVTSTNLGVLLQGGRNRLRECLENRGVGGSHHAEL